MLPASHYHTVVSSSSGCHTESLRILEYTQPRLLCLFLYCQILSLITRNAYLYTHTEPPVSLSHSLLPTWRLVIFSNIWNMSLNTSCCLGYGTHSLISSCLHQQPNSHTADIHIQLAYMPVTRHVIHSLGMASTQWFITTELSHVWCLCHLFFKDTLTANNIKAVVFHLSLLS